MTRHWRKRIGQVPPEDRAFIWSHGVLTEWNDERGYGFVTPDNDTKKVFLHVKSLQPFARRPRVGEEFYYKLSADDQGRFRAEEAFQTILDQKRSTPVHHAVLRGLSWFWALGIIPAFIAAAKTGNLVCGVCTAYAVNSLLTFLFYGEDKYLARYKYWRIPEKCLHLWEFLGGWPGALAAQRAFRHKSSKVSFLIEFWFCIIINIAAVFLLFSYCDTAAIGKTLEAWWQKI